MHGVTHVVYSINKLPLVVLKLFSPYELLYKILPTYLDLKVFGSLCFASSLKNNRTKLEPRFRKCVFLGYKSGIKEYVLVSTDKRLSNSRIHIFFCQ